MTIPTGSPPQPGMFAHTANSECLFDPAELHAALDAVPADAWSLPSTYAATRVHHGYRRVVLVDHGRPLEAASPFLFMLARFAPVHEAWLSWIDPGGFIVPHRDAGPWLERWQVPIVAAGWFQQGFTFTPEDGSPFRVTHWDRHCVGNPTSAARVHAVIDRHVRVPHDPLPFHLFPVPPELEELVGASYRSA